MTPRDQCGIDDAHETAQTCEESNRAQERRCSVEEKSKQEEKSTDDRGEQYRLVAIAIAEKTSRDHEESCAEDETQMSTAHAEPMVASHFSHEIG